MSIPKKIHFIWLGGPMPIWAATNIACWRIRQPDYEIEVHTDISGLLPEHSDAFGACCTLGDQTDVLRYSLLKADPGWYLDADTRPLTDHALDVIAERWPISRELFVARDGKYPNPWCLAATGECAVWETIDDLLAGQIAGRKPYAVFGPRLLQGVEHLEPDLLQTGDVSEQIHHEARGLSREPALTLRN